MKEVVVGIYEMLASEGFRAHLKRLDSTTGKEGVIVRQFGSDSITKRYVDGTENVNCTTQILSRHQDRELCIDECERIIDLLDGANVSSGTYGFVDQSVYLQAQEVEDDEAGYSTWSLVIQTNVTRKRPLRR